MGNEETRNEVKLAGTIETIKAQDTRAFLLVNPGGDTKYIPCTIHDSAQLATKVKKFSKGDLIKITGFVRTWSQKKNDTWVNHVEVRIATIHNEPKPKTREAGDEWD